MSRRKLIWIILGAMLALLAFAFLQKSGINQTAFALEKQRTQENKVRDVNLADTSKSAQSAQPEASNPLTATPITPDEKAPRVVVLTKAEQAELEGNTNNEYGIRQDILQFIEENAPKDNPRAFKAAIKFAQYENQIYYHAKNQKEALMLGKKHSLASRCLMEALPDDWNNFVNGVRVKPQWEKLYEGITKPMRNTPSRDKHMWKIDDTYFAWHLIGSGLSSAEEEEQCKAGNF